MEETKYMEEAIPLITIQEGESEFRVNPNAIDFLQSVPKPIAVVGVAGLYRTGKSYLLNRVILNKGDGFGVGPTINPCTKGIWIWGKPLKGETQDGKIVNVLVIDSEGIGALDEHADHDNRIFSLAILLSSNFIYNSLGSIDETAIQNLNLICNITKNIHIKATQDEETEADEYASYFPAFMWIVRDFTLQLVDSEGDPITSNMYLENALEPQQGFSEAVEKKNRIRRMIRSFFPERDCYTLIRPLLDEGDIQNLPQMELDQLRPDFIEQVLSLRKKVMTRARVKTMNGKQLNGKMLGSLLKNYVSAINKGAVPNIESAWSYICRDQCQQALDSSYTEFEDGMRETLSQSWPVSSGYLKTLYQDLRDTAIVSYKRAAVGETSDKKLKELINKMEQKYYQLEGENRRDYEAALQSGLTKTYLNIEQKLQTKEYKSFFEYERDLRAFQKFYLDTDPNGPGKELIISEFVLHKLPEAVYQIIKDLNSENEEQIIILKQAKSKVESEVQAQKEVMMKKVNDYENKLADLKNEKSDLEVKRQCIEDNFTEYKKRKEVQEQRSKDEYETELADRQNKINTLEDLNKDLEDRISEVERTALIQKSESEKEKALLEQKLEHYKMQSESYSVREKGMSDQMMRVREEMTNQMKLNNQKLQDEIDRKELECKTFEDRLMEAEEELKNAVEKLQDELDSRSKVERKLREELNSMEVKMLSMNEEIEIYRENGKHMYDENMKLSMDGKYEDLMKKFETADSLAKERLDMVNKLKSDKESQKAVSDQTINFLERKLEDMRAKSEEAKKKYTSALSVIEGQSSSNDDFQKTLKEIDATHTKEMKDLEAQLEETRNRLTETNNKLSQENHILSSKRETEVIEYTEKIAKLEEEIASLNNKNVSMNQNMTSIEDDKQKLLSELEMISIQRQRELQEEIDEMREKHMKEIEEIEETNQRNMDEMKKCYEDERSRLETKNVDIKAKADKKYKKMVDEYDLTIENDRQMHEEEIENLHQELKEFEINQIAFRQQYEQEIGARQQTIMNLEATNKELKIKLANLETKSNGNLEQLMKSLKEERNSYMEKIDILKTDITQRDKTIYTYNQSIENLTKENRELKDKIQKYKNGEVGVIGELKKKLETVSEKYQKLNENHMEMKIESEKTIALRNQQNEFLNTRINELQSMIDTNHLRTEEKMRVQREEHQTEISKLHADAREDKRILEDKYEQKRKALKDVESEYSMRFRTIESERSHLIEKLETAQNELSKVQTNTSDEIESLKIKIEDMRSLHNKEKKRLQGEYDKIKNKNYNTELEKAEIVSTFDREKALLEGKITFLQEQNESLQNDVSEGQKTFDSLLMKFKNIKKNQEDESAYNNTALIASIEQKYKNQIEELRESKRLLSYEYNEKVASLERELRLSQEKLKSSSNTIELNEFKSVQEKLRNKEILENKLRQDLEKVKRERDTKSMEYQKMMDEQRERYKRKQDELEVKIKTLEKKKSSLMFEYDKERTKWNVEKDHLNTQLEDKLEILHTLEKKKENLLRENEKLKNENRKNKKLLGNHFPNSLSSMANGGNFMFNLNSSKYNDRSFLRGEQRGTFPSDKDDKENDLPMPSTKFSVLEKLSSSSAKNQTPVKGTSSVGFELKPVLSSTNSNVDLRGV